jgi:glycosyltransferase involved in cell wall biosynthesis
MSLKPTVSLIVPVWNAERWLGECMDSIFLQSYPDFEVILVNDGSTDGSAELCEKYAYLDNRVFLIHQVNHGVAAARNRGLERAKGQFVAFCDADDYLEPLALERLVDAIPGVDMVAGSFRKFGEFEEIIRHPAATLEMKDVAHYAMGNLTNPRSNQMFCGCWAKLYRRELVRRFPDLTTAEDMALVFDYLTRCGKVRFLPEVVYHNRKRTDSLTTTFDESNKPGLFGFLGGLKYVRQFLTPFEVDLEPALDQSKIYHSILYYMRICAQDGGSMRDTFRKLYPS